MTTHPVIEEAARRMKEKAPVLAKFCSAQLVNEVALAALQAFEPLLAQAYCNGAGNEIPCKEDAEYARKIIHQLTKDQHNE